MNEQLRLFEGFGYKASNWVPVEIIDAASAEYTLGRDQPPHIAVDFEKLPSVSDIQQAFANRTPIILVDNNGESYYFHILEDLDYNGWIDSPDVEPPDFVVYEGVVFDQPVERGLAFDHMAFGGKAPRHNRWVLIIEPGEESVFGWNGDDLVLA